jgi:formylglycine-generating enzyme required for sulfatase activity
VQIISIFSWLAIFSVNGFAAAAQASPNDVVIYNETANRSYAVTIEKDASGVEQIDLWFCGDALTQITSVAQQCKGKTSNILKVTDFRAFVLSTIINWAALHPGLDLIPLSAKELASISAYEKMQLAPQVDASNAELAKLKEDAARIKNMLTMAPSSPAYLKMQADNKAELDAKIAASQQLAAQANSGAADEKDVDDLAVSLLELIRKNSADDKPHYFMKSLMEDPAQKKYTLVHTVMETLQKTFAVGGIQFASINSRNASFSMGSPNNEADRGSNETQHQVTFTYNFEMQTTPMTFLEYDKVMGTQISDQFSHNQQYCPDSFDAATQMCGQHPITSIPLAQIESFLQKLNDMKDGCLYRLPTEAEYEFAMRAGTKTAYYFGSASKDDYEWTTSNSGGRTQDVATKKPNAFGLYDMAGSVLELMNDQYQSDLGTQAVTFTDQSYLNSHYSSPNQTVFRGDSSLPYTNTPTSRSAYRYPYSYNGPGYTNVGFRVVRTCGY